MEIGVKKFFRFLRGELNGYYLKRLALFVNLFADNNYNDFFCYMRNMQFDLNKISKDDIFNIASFAGITQTLAQGTLLTNVLLMTDSELKNLKDPCFSSSGTKLNIGFAKQVSERGLYARQNEVFNFNRWNDTSKPDIVDFANENMQATLVPDNSKIEGYVKQDGVIYNKAGEFTGKDLLKDKPTDGSAYTPYYGQKFLQLGEQYLVFRKIPKQVLLNIVIIVQNIRYNGSSTKTFAELADLIVGENGFIKLTEHSVDPNNPLYVKWKYTINDTVEVSDKLVRLEAWKILVESFFPQIVLVEEVSPLKDTPKE